MAQDVLEIPTPEDLRDQWNAEIIAQFPDAQPLLEMSFFRILGKAVALLVHGLYIFAGKIANQIFVSTSSVEFLDRHASEYGVPRLEATAAQGDIQVSGMIGSTVNTGDKLKSTNGVFYSVDLGVTLVATTAIISVTADSFGSQTNQDSGAILTFVSPPSGINSQATVQAGTLLGGADREGDEALRERVLFRKRNPIQCGAPSDYIQWALQVPDVTRAYVYPKENGLGTVVVRFMMDDKYTDGIPLAGDVANVQAYIETLMPAQVALTVEAPVAVALLYDITLSPNTPDVQEAVEQELADLHARDAVPADGVSTGGILVSRIRQAVSNAAGENDNTVNLPAADVPAGALGEIYIFDAVNVTFS
jgi:uncharacterized phage protein gp47/JayE